MTDELQEAVTKLHSFLDASLYIYDRETTHAEAIRVVLVELTRLQTEWGIYCGGGSLAAFVCHVPAQDNEDRSGYVLEAWRQNWQDPPDGMAVAVVTAKQVTPEELDEGYGFHTVTTLVRWE